MSIATGLDRLLAEPTTLDGRRYGLLTHSAAVTHDWVPAHLALWRSPCPPVALFGPEHGLYAVEQDMVASADGLDPWTDVSVISLYGSSERTLVPRLESLVGLDLLLIDLQDVGSRYYTFAATAVWAAEVALAAGCEVWVLDRPNPLGGMAVEGNLPEPDLESFVGAFQVPVRHGLTLGELFLLEAGRRGLPPRHRVWPVEGWRRSQRWEATGRPWIAPSPNMPSTTTALVYPGGCLVEATEVSEGRGTTRPFQLVGAPWVEPQPLAEDLASRQLPGVAFVPTYFKPQFQKHRGEVCGGVEIVVTDAAAFRPYRIGLELLAALVRHGGADFAWRKAPYEFVADEPAIDLLTGSPDYRQEIESGGEGLAELAASWAEDEEAFRRERREILLYPEEP